MMKRQPVDITPAMIECIVMPNGEILCLGKRIGWWSTHKDILTEVK